MTQPVYIMFAVVLVAVIVNVILVFLYRRRDGDQGQQYSVLHQRLDAFSQLVNDQLERSRLASEQVTQRLAQQLEQNRQASERATLTVTQQVQGFTQGMTQLHENLKNMHDSVKSVSSFQEMFRSPKLRGIWGEASLEASLSQYFPKDLYTLQYYFKSGEAVDAILKLPNGIILPIDSKFNWENFEKMINADNDIHRDGFKKLFYSDVKKKIDEISSKYILPSEGTTDFALMYVPAETVYYEIINNTKDVDISDYARKKKVMLVSPNTFFLSVSAIHHWYRDIQISQKTQEIMKKLQRVVADASKLGDDFARLGKHLSDTRSAYDSSEKRLSLMVGRVKNVVQIGSDNAQADQLEEGDTVTDES